jgi:hypothetical protein
MLSYGLILTLLIRYCSAQLMKVKHGSPTPFMNLLGETLYRWNDDKSEILEYSTAELLNNTEVMGIYYR